MSSISFPTNIHDDTHSNVQNNNQTAMNSQLQINYDGYSKLVELGGHDRRRLPNELISNILQHLPKEKQLQQTLYECTLVNKHFHTIANPLLWQELIFYDFKVHSDTLKFYGYAFTISPQRFFDCISEISPQRLSILGYKILSLRLNSRLWTDDTLIRLIPHIPNLQHLGLYPSSNITDKALLHVPYHCRHLTSVELLRTHHLTQMSSFATIGHYCHQLGRLTWHLSNHQSIEWLSLLNKHCPLEHLKIMTYDWEWNENTLLILKSWPRLISLDISNTSDGYLLFKSLLRLTTTTTTTGDWWPHLTTLKLEPCNHIDDITLMEFIKSHSHLEELQLKQAPLLTKDSLDGMAVWLPKLKHVGLTRIQFQISHHDIHQFIKQCRYLEFIKIDSVDGENCDDCFTGVLHLLEIDKIRQDRLPL